MHRAPPLFGPRTEMQLRCCVLRCLSVCRSVRPMRIAGSRMRAPGPGIHLRRQLHCTAATALMFKSILCRLKQGSKNFTRLPDRAPMILMLFCGITRESPNLHLDIELRWVFFYQHNVGRCRQNESAALNCMARNRNSIARDFRIPR